MCVNVKLDITEGIARFRFVLKIVMEMEFVLMENVYVTHHGLENYVIKRLVHLIVIIKEFVEKI